MDIQQFIDRKREAGRVEHEGAGTDWAGWTLHDFHVAIAAELLDLINYAQRAVELFYEGGETDAILGEALEFGEVSLSCLSDNVLEAACAEADAKVKNNRFNCPYCNVEHKLWDALPDSSYIPNDINIIQCGECGEEFDVFIRGQFEFEVMPITGGS